VSWLNSDRVWLILFAGKPFQSVPLSYDYAFLEKFINDLSVDTLDQWNSRIQWTAIWDALVLAGWILNKQENEREKIIILITDGEANRGVKPEISLKLLKDKDIKTYTIWVGKDEETFIDIVLPGGFIQKTPVWGLDEEILKKIADETWWEYFRADSPEAFKEILKTIEKLEKREDSYESYIFHSSILHIVMLIMLVPFLGLMYFVFIKKVHF